MEDFKADNREGDNKVDKDAFVAKVVCPGYQGSGTVETRADTVSDFCTLCGRPEGYHRVQKGSILEEAQEIIHGKRNKDYGSPKQQHETVAAFFNIWIDRKYGPFDREHELDAEDVCWFNIFQKISRQAWCRKRDNLVDIAGYVGNIEMMQETTESTERHKGIITTTTLADPMYIPCADDGPL